MPKYTPTKTLISAKPRIRSSDDVVISWELEVEYSLAADVENNLPEWTTIYSCEAETENLDKSTLDFTKSELISLMPDVYDIVFDDHYEHFNNIGVSEQVEVIADQDFNVDNLAD